MHNEPDHSAAGHSAIAEQPAYPLVEIDEPILEDGHDRPAPRKDLGPAPRKRSGLIAGLLLLLALLAIGGLPKYFKDTKLTADAKADVTHLPRVNVVVARPATTSADLTLPSSIQAIEEATINARISGYLKERYVDIGSRVKAGQTLALVESPETDQQVLEAIATTAKMRADEGQAVADVAKQRAAVAEARSGLAAAKSNLAQSRADAEHQQARLEQARATADVAAARLNQVTETLAQRKADLNHAKAQFELAKKTLARWKELEKVEAVSGQEVDEKQADYDIANAGVSAATAAVNSAQADQQAAKAAVESSHADVRAAQADVKSVAQKVFAAESVVESSRSNIVANEAGVSASRSNAQAAQAEVSSSAASASRYRAMQDYERVVAPFSGVITARNVDVGALINAGGQANELDPTRTVTHSGLFGIAKTDMLRVLVSVPQSFVGSVRAGQPASISVEELPGRMFKGIVYRTAGALDATSRTLLTEVHIPNPDGVLMPGMYAQIDFVAAHTVPRITIPADSLIVDADGTRVATVTPDNRIHFVTVQTGRDLGAKIQVLTGLKRGDRLVSNPSDDLVEGAAVKVVASPEGGGQ